MSESKVSKKSLKKAKKPTQSRSFHYEENTTRRKRIHNRLLRKIKSTVEEMVVRVGQQAMVLVVSPVQTSSSNYCEVYGAQQLVSVVKNLSGQIVAELKQTIKTQPKPDSNSDLFELPALIVNGVLTPVRHMTQAQLRAFIPLMMKYSTGRGKPGWGRLENKPEWWPDDFVPWSNVRMDSREQDQKSKVSWTLVLQQIVINCYRYHGREDLLMLNNKIKENQNEKKEECASNNSVMVEYGELQAEQRGDDPAAEDDPSYNIMIEILEDENVDEREETDNNNNEPFEETITIDSHCQGQVAINNVSNDIITNTQNNDNNNFMSLSLALPPGSCLYGLKPNEDGTWYLLPTDSNSLDVKVADPLIFNIQESVNF